MMTKELLQQALDVLVAMQMEADARYCGLKITDEAITSLRAAIAQPEQPTAQPVFHLREYGDVTQREMLEYIATGAISAAQPESKAAQEKRQPLTDEQIKSACGASDEYWSTAKLYCIAITRITETAHGIKA